MLFYESPFYFPIVIKAKCRFFALFARLGNNQASKWTGGKACDEGVFYPYGSALKLIEKINSPVSFSFLDKHLLRTLANGEL